VGPRNHILDEGPDLPKERENFGVVRPIEKHWELLLCCIRKSG